MIVQNHPALFGRLPVTLHTPSTTRRHTRCDVVAFDPAPVLRPLAVAAILSLVACACGTSTVISSVDAQSAVAGIASASACNTDQPPACEPRASSPAAEPAAWWRDRTFYEVFVRSFADSDGDGIGDLRGLTQRLDYLNDGEPVHDDRPRRHRPVAHAGRCSPELPRVRRHRLRRRSRSGLRHHRRLPRADDCGPCPWHRRHRRPRPQSHLDRPSMVPGRADAGFAHHDWYVWSPTDPTFGRSHRRPADVWHRTDDGYYYGVFWEGCRTSTCGART